MKLESYLGGRWVAGSGSGASLVNPVDGGTVATASSAGLDLAGALGHARGTGRATLGALSFAERAALLSAIADVLTAGREQWYDIARINSGNTKADAAIDIEGAIGTLKFFARAGSGLGVADILVEGEELRLAKDPNFKGRHFGVRVEGVAVHINAFNFPAWGLWGKAAVALLAGVPVFAKPATSTAWLAQAMVKAVIEAGVLPEGSLSILCGGAGDLLDHLRFGDVIAFTGSAETGATIRSHPRLLALGTRVNIEADSLNSALLGPGEATNSPSFDFTIREIQREMTAKAGQKCTAIRRVFVPAAQADEVVDALSAALAAVVVGDPADAAVTMGPLVTMAQKQTAEEGIAALATEAQIVHQPTLDSNLAAGAFIAPTLLRLRDATTATKVHDLEVFGPVATVIPYSETKQAFALARRGGGSLVSSVFSSSTDFLAEAGLALGSSHGRLMLIDPSVGDSHPGHGIVLPSCLHGGPGRAGGGEEMAGLHGLWFYHQRFAAQASSGVIAALAARAANLSGV